MAEKVDVQTNDISDLCEQEMLERLLRLVTPRANITLIADNLIREFGSMNNALQAPIAELKNIDGFSDKFALQFGFVGALINYLNDTQAPVKDRFNDARKITEYCIKHFKNKTTEILTLLLLDEKSKLLNVHDISSNMPNRIDVEFRQIARQAMNFNARKMIIAHNHPTATTEPSNEDLKFTRELSDLLRIIKTELVDHIIVSGGEALSMRDAGYLNGIWGLEYRRP